MTIKMNKKWSCPACEYQSGRGSNVARHISRKHGDYDVPVLTEFRRTDLPHQGSDYSTIFSRSPPKLRQGTLEKKGERFSISSYKFEDKKLEIYKKFLEAQKLPQSDEIRLIIQDLMLQMERAVSSSTYPSGRDLNKKMAS